jgi:Zn finger protein HypA/HybF involved in hydrogenase expression
MIDLNCPSCVWSDSVEPTDDHPQYCPKCGGDVDIQTEPGTLDPAETLSGSI